MSDAESLDLLLHRFEVAWQSLRAVCAEPSESVSDSELRSLVVEAVESRTEARRVAADQLGGFWLGDQHVHVVELRVGALARDLDGFCQACSTGSSHLLTAEQLQRRVRPLIVRRGVERQALS